MSKILFDLNSNHAMAETIASGCGMQFGKLVLRKFPDGESYIRLETPVGGKDIAFFCSLHHPDEHILSLLFASQLVKENGAGKITLVSPYLPYMRQDNRFREGEAITSLSFAKLLSSYVDELITIDPHLHRFSHLSELYTIPAKAVHAAECIANYIQANIRKAIVIGPDSESAQWVEEVARLANVPHLVLQKERFGDRQVKISVPKIEAYRDCFPVLVDDIVSTAHTMIESVNHLKDLKMAAPVCIAVHPIFSGTAYEDLKSSGAADIISCNTVVHASNKIDITNILIRALS